MVRAGAEPGPKLAVLASCNEAEGISTRGCASRLRKNGQPDRDDDDDGGRHNQE